MEGMGGKGGGQACRHGFAVTVIFLVCYTTLFIIYLSPKAHEESVSGTVILHSADEF